MAEKPDRWIPEEEVALWTRNPDPTIGYNLPPPHRARGFPPARLSPSSSCSGEGSTINAKTNISFFPYPKSSFLLECHSNLVCEICHESKLRFRSDRYKVCDETPALLPCGHIAGFTCLSSWIQAQVEADPTNVCCPTCRMPILYEKCGHAVSPRPIVSNSIQKLPRTIPGGGTIPDLCMSCTNKENQRKAKRQCNDHKEKLNELQAIITDGEELVATLKRDVKVNEARLAEWGVKDRSSILQQRRDIRREEDRVEAAKYRLKHHQFALETVFEEYHKTEAIGLVGRW